MEMENLRTFVLLSETKNYTQAASRLYVAQSTVTNRIQELEEELGVSLLVRSNRSVALTRAGEQFLAYAVNVLELTEKTLADITSAEHFTHTLRIGASDSIYDTHLSQVLPEYRKVHPDYAIKISIGQSDQLLQQLQAGVLDMVFCYLPLRKKNFVCEVYKCDAMVLVTDWNNHRYEEGITREELPGLPYIMCNFALQEVGQYIRKLFPRYHQFALEIDDCSKVIPYLAGEENYTFLPKAMADGYIQKKRLREIPLKDFDTPVINSYCVAAKEKMPLWQLHEETKQ